jgi:hypothetical protein
MLEQGVEIRGQSMRASAYAVKLYLWSTYGQGALKKMNEQARR